MVGNKQNRGVTTFVNAPMLWPARRKKSDAPVTHEKGLSFHTRRGRPCVNRCSPPAPALRRLPSHHRSRCSPKATSIRSSAASTSRPRATRWRSAASTAPCAISTPTGTSTPRRFSRRSLKADPTCAMAQWGIALTLLDNPHNADPAAQPRAGPGRDPEGQGDERQDRARARLHRRADC